MGKFLLSYIVLIVLYQWYLNQFDARTFEVDGATNMVARHSKFFLEIFNYDVTLTPRTTESAIKMAVNQDFLVRIIEGCNAVSVMILFAAFVIAFSGTFKKTVLFIISGILLIHILNIMRIGLLCLGLLYYPQYSHVLHDIVFPLFIYGVVFALWVIWINKFSFYAKKTPQS
ncbi:exosortase family protein XrtF [Flavobacterium sp. 3HN19-14]|uniref:exosortase family protein XrtF n=1 Tax=Flavobacterium sp. 3HN19-14 TaxID=3448133 RepID=UPI003EE0CC89